MKHFMIDSPGSRMRSKKSKREIERSLVIAYRRDRCKFFAEHLMGDGLRTLSK